MKQGTIALSWHRWRGFRVDRQLFLVAIILGVITIDLSRKVLDEELNRLRDKLKRLGGDNAG